MGWKKMHPSWTERKLGFGMKFVPRETQLDPCFKRKEAQPAQRRSPQENSCPHREEQRGELFMSQLCFFHLVSGSMAVSDNSSGKVGALPSPTPLSPTHSAAPYTLDTGERLPR